jgi:hypothetical protein
MITDPATFVLSGFDEVTRRHATALLEAFCEEHRVDRRIFEAEELQSALEEALGEPVGSPGFHERFRDQCLGCLHGKMVELARDGFVLPTGLDPARYAGFVGELERRYGKIQPREVGLFVYGVVNSRTGRTFEVEMPGRKPDPDATLDASDAPLGNGKDHLGRLRQAIASRRIGVTESSGATARRVPIATFAAVLEEYPTMEVIGPIAVR